MGHTRGKPSQDIAYRDAHMPDTWFASAFARFDSDYVFIVGHLDKNNHNILVVRGENMRGDSTALTRLFFNKMNPDSYHD